MAEKPVWKLRIVSFHSVYLAFHRLLSCAFLLLLKSFEHSFLGDRMFLEVKGKWTLSNGVVTVITLAAVSKAYKTLLGPVKDICFLNLIKKLLWERTIK